MTFVSSETESSSVTTHGWCWSMQWATKNWEGEYVFARIRERGEIGIAIDCRRNTVRATYSQTFSKRNCIDARLGDPCLSASPFSALYNKSQKLKAKSDNKISLSLRRTSSAQTSQVWAWFGSYDVVFTANEVTMDQLLRGWRGENVILCMKLTRMFRVM